MELLFSNQKSHKIDLPAKVTEGDKEKPVDVQYLIFWLRDNLLKEREELFIENGTVYVVSRIQCTSFIETACYRRPGILVLVNDTDWELEGEGEYQLKDGDEIVFISTLHGG